jgi:hypothetical protein
MSYIKLDIAYLVSKLSIFTSNPIMSHKKAIKRILKYLSYILDYKLHYTSYPTIIEEYSNAN